jgi:hypothetical protein
MLLGAIALLAAVIVPFAGPLERRPSLEEAVTGRAATLRDRTVAVLQGRPVPPAPAPSAWNADRVAMTATSGIGAMAAILGVIGFVRREDRRAAFAAIGLGIGAIAFQMLIFAMVVAAVLLVLFMVLNLGF